MSESTWISWQDVAEKYRAGALAKIPESWRLPAKIISTISSSSDRSVLHIPRSCGLLTEEELTLTESYDVVSMVEMLATGKVSSVALTRAFCKRAAIAQQLTYCLTETFFDVALDRARFCDEYLTHNGKTLGAFHGLPISIKV
jgi:amidase